MVAHNFLQSVRLLADGMVSFNDHCAVGIEPNRERITELVQRSLMLVTALNTAHRLRQGGLHREEGAQGRQQPARGGGRFRPPHGRAVRPWVVPENMTGR